MLIARKSLASNTVRTMDIPCSPEQLATYELGEKVEKALPDCNRWHREFVISGITRSEWIDCFGEEDNTYGITPT